MVNFNEWWTNSPDPNLVIHAVHHQEHRTYDWMMKYSQWRVSSQSLLSKKTINIYFNASDYGTALGLPLFDQSDLQTQPYAFLFSGSAEGITVMSLEYHGISIHWQLRCLLNSLFRLRTKQTSQPCVTSPLWEESTSDLWIQRSLVDTLHKGPISNIFIMASS